MPPRQSPAFTRKSGRCFSARGGSGGQHRQELRTISTGEKRRDSLPIPRLWGNRLAWSDPVPSRQLAGSDPTDAEASKGLPRERGTLTSTGTVEAAIAQINAGGACVSSKWDHHGLTTCCTAYCQSSSSAGGACIGSFTDIREERKKEDRKNACNRTGTNDSCC